MAIPSWYQKAIDEVGVQETPGKKSTPRIIEYHSKTGLEAKDELVSWCGSFVGWCMDAAGIKYIRNTAAGAREWLKWGKELKEPIIGCVVILKRGAPPAGHVGFFAGWVDDTKRQMRLLSGNVSNMVKMETFPAADVLGYRWPTEIPLPIADQPLKKSGTIWNAMGASAGVVVAVAPAAPEVMRQIQEGQNLDTTTVLGMIGVAMICITIAGIIISRVRGQRAEIKIQTDQ